MIVLTHYMHVQRTYRTSALILALVFCLFNVGLPIVISACPMMRSGSARGSCCIMNEKPAKPTLAVSRSSSCCRTVVAANRNTTEFLQSNNHDYHLLKIETLKIAVITSDQITSGVALHYTSSSTRCAGTLAHPPDDDIPILTSSLLI